MIYVKDTLGNTQPLNTKLFNEFRINQKISGDFTLQMTTVKSENNPGANILDSQSVIHINGYNFVVKMYSENAYTKTVTAVNEYFENNKHQVPNVYNGVNTLEAQLQFALANTGWILQIDPTIANIRQTIEDLGNDNTVALVERIKEAHGVEYLIRPNNVIYFARQIGPDNQFVYRYKANINDVVLQQDTTNLTTFIRGTGANGITATYTSPNVSQFGVLEAEPFSDERFTSVQTLTDKLQTLIIDTPQIVISSSIPDLTLRDIGERIWINYEPLDINIKVRIIEQNLTLRNDELISTNIIFGNTIYSSLSDSFVAQQKGLKDTQKAIENARVDYNNKFDEAARNTEELIQIAANGKNTIFTRTTEPPRGSAIEGDLWFRPLGNGETQQYQFIGGVWVLINDTSDLTAVQREVEQAIQDSQSAIDAANQADVKADEALNNANTAINNAQTAFNNANTAINNAQTAFDNAQEALDREFRPRNLARFTNTNRVYNLFAQSTLTFETIYDDYVSARTTANQPTNNTFGIGQNNAAVLMEIKRGKTYTLSFKLKSNRIFNINSVFFFHNQGNIQLVDTDDNLYNANGEYKEFKYKVTIARNDYDRSGVYIGVNGIDIQIGDYIEIKDIAVYEGENIYDWNAAPEDVGYQYSQFKVSNNAIAARVGNAEGNISSLTITSQGLQSQVNGKVDNTTYNSYVTQTNQALQARLTSQEAEDTYATKTTLTATAQGLQTQVNGKVDNTTYNSYVTQTNNAIQARITATEANATFATQSTLTQTSNAIISRIESIENDVNLYEGTQGFTGSKWVNLNLWSETDSYNGFAVRRNANTYGGLSQEVNLQQGKQYTFSFFAKADNGIGVLRVYGNGTGGAAIAVGIIVNTITNQWARHSVTFTAAAGGSMRIRLEKTEDTGLDKFLYVAGLKLVEGVGNTEWNGSPYDAYSSFTQLQDNINLKVNKNDVVNQINVSTEGILIAGNKVRITGQTVIDDASIQSSKIVSLNADKINAGTLNAANVNITNLNASNITTGSLNVARLGAGQIVGNTLKTSNTQNYVILENQYVDFFNEGLRKMRLGFNLNSADNTYFPKIDFGAGDVNGRNMGTILKTTQGFDLQYTIPNSAGGGRSFLSFGSDGELAVVSPGTVRLSGDILQLSTTNNRGYVKSGTNGFELTRSTTQPSRIVVRLNGTDLGYLQIL